MSDGSSYLTFRDEAFQVIKKVQVLNGSIPVTQLNELEYINGLVFANIWFSNEIAVINPNTGRVVGFIDLSSLKQPEGVLNGIAYNSVTDTIYVTGKNWSKLFEIKVNLG
eukprot:TRINITY_DN1364_c0_g1_i3.p2 TRINITY_DN1364_c0_g1~~TRINITY_DN1364_c0_g1_i3.p2  ORF type:complete len:110 (+),score=21.26 TRINITY_DN1364_c0_g1_i3:434-763(+)